MFKPKHKITNRLLANIKRITELVAQLNAKHLSRTVLLALEKEARELSSFSSTSIEGNPLPLTEVKKILKNKPENMRETEREVINYNQALEKLNKLLNQSRIELTTPLILEIQRGITQGLIAKHRCGRFRLEPVFVNDPRVGKTIYWPPDHQAVKDLMNDLLSYIHKNKTKVDPLILAGLFHKQFVIIHPFIDGNGRTARLATKVLLASMGLNTFNLFSFENYYNRNVSQYFAKVGVLGNYYDIKAKIDFTDWLEYFTDGIIDELLRVSKELAFAAISPETTLKEYHQKIINYIKDKGYITDREYSTITNRAKATRNKDFNNLISLGLIERSGKGKATYYKLKQG